MISEVAASSLSIGGLVVNTQMIVMLSSNALRNKCTTPYLLSLCVSNLVAILSNFIDMPLSDIIVVIKSSTSMCQIGIYSHYVSSFVASWSVVGFTVERAVAVTYPLRHIRSNSLLRAYVYVVVVVAAALAYYSWTPFFLEVIAWNGYSSNETVLICIPKQDQSTENLFRIFNVIDIFMSFGVPVIVICIGNSIISYRLYKSKLERDQLGESTRSRSSRPRVVNDNESVYWIRPLLSSELRTTLVLILLSCVYVCCNVPNYLMKILGEIEIGTPATKLIWGRLCYFLYLAQFVCGGLMYCFGFRSVKRLREDHNAMCTRERHFRLEHLCTKANVVD